MKIVQQNCLLQLSGTIAMIALRELCESVRGKKLVRLEIYITDLRLISNEISRLGLSFSISDKSFKLVGDTTLDNWSSSMSAISDEDQHAMRFLYVHEKQINCDTAKVLDEQNDDLNLGILLGYPRCCIHAYLSWQKDNDDIDPITIITNAHPYTGHLTTFKFPNPFSRYFGLGLYSHFPCSLHCEPTAKLVIESLTMLKNDLLTVLDRISQLENALVIFDKEKGICLWTDFQADGNKIQVRPNTFMGQGQLKHIFEQVNQIEMFPTELLLQTSQNSMSVYQTGKCFLGAFIEIA